MNFKKIILLLLIILAGSCRSNENSSHQEGIQISITPRQGTLQLDSLYTSFSFVKFLTPSISYINEVQRMDSLYVIRAKSSKSDIHIYSNNGAYNTSAINIGRGPKEALNVQNFTINHPLRQIDVLCNFGTTIIQYSVDDKNIIKTITLPVDSIYVVEDIEVIDNDRYLLYKNIGNCECSEYKLYVYNHKTDKIEDTFLELDKKAAEYISFSQKNNLFKINNIIYFYEAFSDCVFCYSNGKLLPYILFAENKYSFPKDLLFKGYADLSNFLDVCESSHYIWAHINARFNGNRMLSYFRFDNELYLNVIDVKKKTSTSFSKINDNLIFNTEIEPMSLYSFVGNTMNQTFYSVDTYKFIELANKENASSEIKEFASHLSEDDNPILVILNE